MAIWGSRKLKDSWSAPEELVREPDVPTWNPVLFYTADQRLWLYLQVRAESGHLGSGSSHEHGFRGHLVGAGTFAGRVVWTDPREAARDDGRDDRKRHVSRGVPVVGSVD